MATGKWEQQIVTWTGDGTSARLIPTTFSLASGVVAIWVFPQITKLPTFRSNNMPGTIYATTTPDTLGGVMSFVSGGFTVTNSANSFVNTSAAKYTAIVLRDSTSDNRYMHVGSYVGSADLTRLLGPYVPLTQLWIFAQGVPAWRSDDFTADQAVVLLNAAVVLTHLITSLGGPFTCSSDSNVNTVGFTHYYVALSIPVGDPIRNLFCTYKTTGTGSILTVSGFGFTPAFAVARPFTAAGNESAWRGPWHTGNTSTNINPTFPSASGHIRAFGVGTLDLGTIIATVGMDVYGFALAASGSVDVTPATVSVPEGWQIHRLDIHPREEERS